MTNYDLFATWVVKVYILDIQKAFANQKYDYPNRNMGKGFTQVDN